jgi:nucleotide-binding universal stress UspA family protein
VHVSDASSESTLDARIARIADESRVLGVALETELVPGREGHVAERLLEIVPEGATLLAGTRARPRKHAFLAGTVSARLLETTRCSVIAMRVVHPGVLGQPGNVLLPLHGRPGEAALALPLLRLLGEDLRRLHVLVVREGSGFRFRSMRPERVATRRAEGRLLAASIEDDLRTGLAPRRVHLDSSVAVSDDAATNIRLCAGAHHSRLIGIGALRRSLLRRLVRGNPVEQLLRDAPTDVAVYRSVD